MIETTAKFLYLEVVSCRNAENKLKGKFGESSCVPSDAGMAEHRKAATRVLGDGRPNPAAGDKKMDRAATLFVVWSVKAAYFSTTPVE